MKFALMVSSYNHSAVVGVFDSEEEAIIGVSAVMAACAKHIAVDPNEKPPAKVVEMVLERNEKTGGLKVHTDFYLELKNVPVIEIEISPHEPNTLDLTRF